MLEMTTTEIDQLLEEARIGRLCMASADGRPYAIPMPFCWTGESLYLRVAMTGRKGQVLQENDRVCFEVDHFTDTLDDYASVLIEGRLTAVSDFQERVHVKRLNDMKYNRLRLGHRPGHGRTTPLRDLPLCRIIVEQVSGRKKDPAGRYAGPTPMRDRTAHASVA